jgi:hypothetical protein
MSNRGEDWQKFSAEVLDHIENYTVPQYGDKPDDQVSEWTADDFATTLRRYCARIGKNMREGEQDRDFLKIAHYAQMAAAVLRGEP